ncbi:ROK family protein [Actinomycetaceae bacterium L2_0104]
MGRPTQLLEAAVPQYLFAGVNISAGALHGVLTNARAEVSAESTQPLMGKDPGSAGAAVSSLIDRLVETLDRTDLEDSGNQVEPPRLCRVTISVGGGTVGDRVGHEPSMGRLGEDLLQHVKTSLPTVTDLASEPDSVVTLERWFGAGVTAESFAIVTVGEEVGSRFVTGAGPNLQLSRGREGNSSTERSSEHPDTSAHLPIAGASGICQYGHVGCATGALSSAAVLGRARSGRILIGDSEQRPFNLADLTYLADIGDEPSRRALGEYGMNLAIFLTTIARATSVRDVVLNGEGLVLLENRWAEESFGKALTDFKVPGVADLRIMSRPHHQMRKARGAAAVGIARFLLES